MHDRQTHQRTARRGTGGASGTSRTPGGTSRSTSGTSRTTGRRSRTTGDGAGPAAGTGKLRMTRRGRVLAWTGGVLGVLLLGTAGVGAWVYQHLDGNIHGVDIGVDGARPVNLSPGSKNILVVGSDSRAGANAKYGRNLTTMQSDTLMVLHIAANRKWATALSFPRDSWVQIPACTRGNGSKSSPHHFKINEAFSIGGDSGDIRKAAACTIKTVEKNTGLRIDHFTSVDFQGFKGMVNALGGIEVCPKHAIHDKKAHLDMDAGCQNVRDEKALGYVRTRYSVGDGSDLGRIGRQQEFMKALGAKAQSKLTSPGELYDFLNSATKSLTTDNALAGIKPLYDLAATVKDIPTDRLTFLTVPNYYREADVPTDKANVVWQYPQAGRLFSDLAHDREIGAAGKQKLAEAAKNPVTAHAVQVRVLNGTGVPGRAASAADQLRGLGFTVVGTGNAPATDKTTVSYPAALKTQSEVLSSRLPGIKATESAGAAPGAVTLTIGPDFPTESH
ncbi:transcriptional attenuator, LytR family [Streptomyces sp. 2224.1]|nr:LytR family transcriptional attenuator [Streptomyces sp. 2321.6]SEC03757.1 transcriptional attenuator, LytR family [Streptomyces sp. 2224.1]SEC99621.1 transcriptional attenuator, LytR family [Streptomyces sp. 2133.1]